jgi:DNA-binding response OmpR family regulator
MPAACRPGPERRLNTVAGPRRSWGTIIAVPEVLLVEDDAALRAAVARALRDADLVVTTAGDGTQALATAGRGPGTRFAAVVLDIGLPDSDGRDVCQALRARGIDVPVLFLTARDQLHDLLSGYAAGGDEYLTKPFHVRELVVRLQALLRRAAPGPPRDAADLHLDPAGHALEGPTGRLSLTPTEFRLLALLMAAPGDVVRRRELARAGWPDGAVVSENTLDQYVARLRRKLGEAGDHGRFIGTVVGVGYRFQ